MPDLPTSWTALCAVVLLLGMRHGFDADHLAAIDGLTRLAASQRRAYTRYCGILFALGHGAVVLGIAAAVGLLSERWTPPGWLNAFGAWVSIAFLMLIGIGNLRAVLQAAPGTVVCLVGLKGPWISRLLPGRGPLGIAAVSGVSLLVAALGVAKLLSPAIEGWSGGKEVAVGAIVVSVIGASYLAALWLAGAPSASQRQVA